MDVEDIDRLHDAVGTAPGVDLPGDRRAFALVAAFLARNPSFDTSAPPEKLDALRAVRGTDRDVWLPEDDDDLDRLIEALKTHDDLDLLAELVAADDPGTVLAALGHDAAAGRKTRDTGRTTTDSTGTDEDGDGDDGGWLSDDDEDFLDHEDLDRFGERLAYAGGGTACLAAVVAAFLTGFTVYKDVDSWILTLELADTGAVVATAFVTTLVAGLAVGFVYRASADEVYDGYRGDLAAATFEVPLFATILGGLLYLGAPIVLNLVNLLVVDAILYTVALAIVLFIAGVPLLVAVFVVVGLVAGVPAYAGVYGGTLLGVPVAAVRS